MREGSEPAERFSDSAKPVLGGVVRFADFREGFAEHETTLTTLIESNDCRSVCEVGGGANPLLPLAYVARQRLRYCVLDVAREELAKAPAGYDTLIADICGASIPVGGPFDLVFSRMLAEHVRDPEAFHRNVHHLLRPGGVAFHFFPTLFAPPFVINRLIPEGLSALALRLFAPRDPVSQGKFPAYYRWCLGPLRSQQRRLQRLGYTIESYVGFFGHGYYDRIPVLRAAQRTVVRALTQRPIPALTSFAYLVMRKHAEN